MPHRNDISEHLVHYTKGDNAFDVLRVILRERRILGTTNNIKGEHRCVCFTEAPLAVAQTGLKSIRGQIRYAPFGVMFDKRTIYEKGGRPAIYQGDAEYGALPQTHAWRHVRYEPGVFDFTWEREWRLHADELEFTPAEAVVLIPTRKECDELTADHEAEQEEKVLAYSELLGEEIAEQYREDFPWRIVILDA